MDKVKIIECPRDAWQGLPNVIPTDAKVAYLRKLIESGFRHLDAVSFVAPKYVPQMADSERVIQHLVEGDLLPIETGNLEMETGVESSLKFPISRRKSSASLLTNTVCGGRWRQRASPL